MTQSDGSIAQEAMALMEDLKDAYLDVELTVATRVTVA